MRYLGAMAALIVISPAGIKAGSEIKPTDQQLACVSTAAKEYLTTNSEFVQRAMAGNLLMSIDDQVVQRRLVESYCKQYATCLVSNTGDPKMRETALRGMFAGCLDDEAKEK
jgi:hypothetical protein